MGKEECAEEEEGDGDPAYPGKSEDRCEI